MVCTCTKGQVKWAACVKIHILILFVRKVKMAKLTESAVGIAIKKSRILRSRFYQFRILELGPQPEPAIHINSRLPKCLLSNILLFFYSIIHCVSKNIPDIFNCNLEKNYSILIIFSVNIHDTACH